MSSNVTSAAKRRKQRMARYRFDVAYFSGINEKQQHRKQQQRRKASAKSIYAYQSVIKRGSQQTSPACGAPLINDTTYHQNNAAIAGAWRRESRRHLWQACIAISPAAKHRRVAQHARAHSAATGVSGIACRGIDNKTASGSANI